MNALTLKHLRYFVALAEHKHFARAADFCAISQPALSLQIKQLEELAGAPLFERTTRSVNLTALGRLLTERVNTVLQNVDDIRDTFRAANQELVGKFYLGIIPTIAPYLLPHLLSYMSKHFPSLDLFIRDTSTSVLIEELKNGDLDAAILALPISEVTLKEVALFKENFLFVRPKNQKDFPAPEVNTLLKLNLLLLEEGHCFREQALSFCSIDKNSDCNIMDGSSLTTLVQLVAAGMGVTLIPEMAASIEANNAEVDIATFPDIQPSREIGMIWRKKCPLEEHLMGMSEVVKTAAQKIYEC